MYRIYKKQGNKILGSLDINEKGLIQALTNVYPMDAQKSEIAWLLGKVLRWGGIRPASCMYSTNRFRRTLSSTIDHWMRFKCLKMIDKDLA